jgi:alkylhydroperoxidase family enzyme
MPVIQPLEIDRLPQDLQAEIRGGQASGLLPSTVAVQIWAHRPDVTTHWIRTMRALHEDGLLDERLRELVRLRIASHTDCRSCQLARKSDTVTDEDAACIAADDARWTPAEQAALSFADMFAVDYASIDDEQFLALRQFFSVEEIVELSLFAALMLAGGRLNYVMRGWKDDERPPVLAAEASEPRSAA